MPDEMLRNTDRRSLPVAVLTILIISAAVFLLLATLGQSRLLSLIQTYGFTPSNFTAPGAMIRHPSSLLSPVLALFIHTTLGHLLVNVVALFVFGRLVESRLGRTRFVLAFIVCGIIGNIGYFLANPMSYIPAIGSTGAVMGIAGVDFIVWVRGRSQSTKGIVPYIKWSLLVIALLLNLSFLGTRDKGRGIVAVTGLVSGLVFGTLVTKTYKEAPSSRKAV